MTVDNAKLVQVCPLPTLMTDETGTTIYVALAVVDIWLMDDPEPRRAMFPVTAAGELDVPDRIAAVAHLVNVVGIHPDERLVLEPYGGRRDVGLTIGFMEGPPLMPGAGL